MSFSFNQWYCKHCGYDWIAKYPENGDFLFVCPSCKYEHYRHVEKGLPMHCDINKSKSEPIRID